MGLSLELSLTSLIVQTYGFALATIFAALLLILVRHSGGTDRSARYLFGVCLLIANSAGLAKNLAYLFNQHTFLTLAPTVRSVGFIAAAFLPLSLVDIWRIKSATRNQLRIGMLLSRYALLSGLAIASGLAVQAWFPEVLNLHVWLRFFADQDRIGNLTFYNGLFVAGVGAATLLPGQLRDLTLRIAVILILLGLSISSAGALLQSSGGIVNHSHHLYNLLRFQGIGLVVLGALLYFSRFRAADIFAKQAIRILIASAFGLGISVICWTALSSFGRHDVSSQAAYILGSALLMSVGIGVYSIAGNGTDRFVERFIFNKRDAKVAIAKYRDELANIGERSRVLASAIELSHELLSARVRTIFLEDTGQPVSPADIRILIPGNNRGLSLAIEFPEHRGFLLSGEIRALNEIGQHVGRRLLELEREEERLQALLQESHLKQSAVESELRALRAQVNPHFLFNSLNTIAALVTDEPAVAETITVRLASIFRHVLLQADRPLCRLIDEVEFLKAYLEIEKIRFGDRLEVSFRFDPILHEAMIPSLILQPLVENAIKHAVAPKVGRSYLTLEGVRSEGRMLLAVEDDGVLNAGLKLQPPSRNQGQSTGMGLKNVRERLALMYGPAACLSWTDMPSGGKRFTIDLPWRN